MGNFLGALILSLFGARGIHVPLMTHLIATTWDASVTTVVSWSLHSTCLYLPSAGRACRRLDVGALPGFVPGALLKRRGSTPCHFSYVVTASVNVADRCRPLTLLQIRHSCFISVPFPCAISHSDHSTAQVSARGAHRATSLRDCTHVLTASCTPLCHRRSEHSSSLSVSPRAGSIVGGI